MAGGLLAPAGGEGWTGHLGAIACALAALLASALLLRRWTPPVEHGLAAAAILLGAAAPLILLAGDGPFGTQAPGLWLFVAGWTVFLWQRLSGLARRQERGWSALLAPALFGLAVLYLWQVLVVGFGVPQVLLPSPAQVGKVLLTRMDICSGRISARPFSRRCWPGLPWGRPRAS